MTVTATAKRRRRQARMINGRKADRNTFKQMILAKMRGKK
jgi:hypothetical protein